MRYGPKVKAEIKKEFVEGTPAKVSSDNRGGQPSAQQILNWAHVRNPETGKTWVQERDEYANDLYEDLSPQKQAAAILRRINQILHKKSGDVVRQADALSKLQKAMEKLIDRRFQLPTMFHLLTRFISFLSANPNYKPLLTEELLNAVRHFKNELKEEFENVR